MSTFNTKEDIIAALSFVEEVRTILNDFNRAEPDYAVRKLYKRLCRAARSLSSACNHAQVGALANAGIRYASIATVDVGARAVHNPEWVGPSQEEEAITCFAASPKQIY